MDAVARIHQALSRSELQLSELTARRLGAFLGKTTSVVYHRWGCLDGLLYAVAQRGFGELGEGLAVALQRSGPGGLAEAYVGFGLDKRVLYSLMFDRVYDWDALRKAGEFDTAQPSIQLWDASIAMMASGGSAEPETDARLLFATLHGIVSLAASGRANVGELSSSDRDVALRLARRAVAHLLPLEMT